MMRRSRISIKPNFRPGNRSGTEGEHASQRASVAGDTLPAAEAEEVARSVTSHQPNMALKEPSEDVGEDSHEMPSQMIRNDGAPSSGATASPAAPHRRMRISATPKLVRPKLTSKPQAPPSVRMPSSAPSPMPIEEHDQICDSASEARDSASIISNLSESGMPRMSTSPTELPTPSSVTTQSSPLCVPSTSGLRKCPLRGEKSTEKSPPSPQPGQVPQQPSQEPEPPECPSTSDLSSVCMISDKAGSSELVEKSSDKDRILRALKLKELMKVERRKDIQLGKRKAGNKEYIAVDRSKMTMRDLIHYLPNTSPMRSSVVQEENQAETIIPPSPMQQIKTAEMNEDDVEEEEENEEMLVPKVRVAADGSIILDEESLTVRVQRTSNTKVVESANALFERGSTTTYSSFRTPTYVKSWSVRETDMFFLAISMVGTDFSLIGQLLTHRNRAAIRNKFKKEERLNPWRVDKAFRNKRPYDKEFFSYLLEKVLAKDKDKRKSVRLVLPKTRKPRKSKGDQEELEDDGDVSLEKENEDVSNVQEADTSVPAKKRRKCTRDVRKDKDNDSSTEEQVIRKTQRKSRKKTREVHSNEDTEGESNLNVEGDTVNLNKEDELERSTSASKRRRKGSKSGEEEQNEKPVKGKKGKQLKKSLKALCDHEESVTEREESSIMDKDVSATKKKRKGLENSDLDGDEAAKGKKKTQRKTGLKKSTLEEEGTAEEGEASADLQEAEKLSASFATEEADDIPQKTSRRSKKPLPNLATTQHRKSNKPEASVEVARESQHENNHESILMASGSPLEDERLQMEAVVVLEKTPPREQHLPSPSKVQSKNNELEPSVSSPASPSSCESSSTKQTRKQSAGRVKRDRSSSGRTGRRTGTMDQGEVYPESPMALLRQITRESEDEEDDISLNENLIDLSCVRDLNSQSFQRRPMVVLSREEVDMFFDPSDESVDDEDPSVSPLDLSLNSELSFPLQCSKILGDINEEAEADHVLEEHEQRTDELASCEERNCEELELRESALAQTNVSNLRDISNSLNPEVCSQPELTLGKVTTSCPMEEAEPQVHLVACKDETTVATVHDVSPHLGVQDQVDPICMKLVAPMTQEPVSIEMTTLGTSLEVSDVMEESENVKLPTLLKESELASSEITAQSELTPTGSRLGSQTSLEATPEVKGELQASLVGTSQTLETLQDSSRGKEDTQESAMASPAIDRAQGCAVALEVKEGSQEEVSVQSSTASVSPGRDIRPIRSRILKPKPNLSQKSKVSVLQNQRPDLRTPSTLKPKSSKPTVSTEKLLCSPATDQHSALEDFSKENLTKEEVTSQSNTMDQMESDSTKDLSDVSTVVPEQENITTVTLTPTSAHEPQVASEYSRSRCDVDMTSPSTSLTLPQPSQTGGDADTGSEQKIVPSEDVFAPVEILHSIEDGHSDEERPNELASCEAQTDVSNLRDISNSLNPEVCSQPELTLGKVTTSCPMEEAEPQVHPVACKDETTVATVHDVSPHLGVQDQVDPICMKLVAPMTQEPVSIEMTTLGTSLEVSDVMEESENVKLPTLLKESELASSEITAQSELTPTGSRLGSQTSLEATPEVKGELQVSLVGTSQTLESLQDSSGSKEHTQESAKASPEIRDRTQGCAVALEVKEGSQEEVSVQSRPTRRSRILKPKPNLSQKSRVSVLQNQRLESESSKDLSDVSTVVPEQENITTVTLTPASAHEPQVASECSRCEVDMTSPSTSLTLPQPSQIGGDVGTGSEQKIVLSEDIFAPAEILHSPEDGCSDEEPIFILTLYEIPVTQAYLPLSSNDSAVVSDLPTDETQASLGFLGQAHTLPSTAGSARIDSLSMESSATENVYRQNYLGVVTEHLPENVKEEISESQEIPSLHTNDENSEASTNLEMGISSPDSNLECKKTSEFAPLDLAPRIQGTPSVSVSECITALPQDSADTEQCERVSHMVLTDVFIPVSEEMGDDSNKDRTMAVENKLPSKAASTACFTEIFAGNITEQTSSYKPILLDTKDEQSDACANLETDIPHRDPDSESKKGSEIAPLEDLASRIHSTPYRRIITLPQDSEDTEHCESVSHMVLADFFVPVSEETGEDSSKDKTMDVECKLENKEASTANLPKRQDTPYENLTKVEYLPAVSNPLLCSETTEEPKDTPTLSEEKKVPSRKRAKQNKPQPKLVKRTRVKGDPSKIDSLVKEPTQPTSPNIVLPAPHVKEKNLAGISNTTDEKSVDRVSPIRGNKTSMSRGKEVKRQSIAVESPEMSQGELESTDSKPISTAVHPSKEPTLEKENSENIPGDTVIKDDMESSAEDKELTISAAKNFNLMKTSGSDSTVVSVEETEAESEGVSHMVLNDVFVLISDEMEDDLSSNWTEPIKGSPPRVSLPKKSGTQFRKELKTEDVSQTLIEESTQNQSPLVDIKRLPVRKKGKQEVKRTCTKIDFIKTRLSQPTSPHASSSSSSSSQLTTLPQDENMVLLEEKLQRRHHIMPCTVKLSSLDAVAQSLNAPQLGDEKSNMESTVMSSPTCHASVTPLSEESSPSALFKEIKMEEPEVEKKSPTRRKGKVMNNPSGKKRESSPHAKRGHIKPVQTVSQTRQLTVTDWAKKKPHQTVTNQKEKEPVKLPQVQSSLKAKEVHQLMVEKRFSTSQHADSEVPEGPHLVPALEETEEVSSISKEVKKSSGVVKESTEEPSVSQEKKSPARRRPKLQVKPILSKRACTKSKGPTSAPNQPQTSRFTSPTRQHARAAREKEESETKTKPSGKEVSNTPSMEANSKGTESSSIRGSPHSPKSQDPWPRVVLPRVKLQNTESDVCSASSMLTSSPARVPGNTSPPVTPPQVKKSPTQSGSPTAGENSDDDPSRVFQFFLGDIFTEVEEAE